MSFQNHVFTRLNAIVAKINTKSNTMSCSTINKPVTRSKGNLLQNLLSTVVVIKKCNSVANVNKSHQKSQPSSRFEVVNDLSVTGCCSICSEHKGTVHQITSTEKSILDEFVFFGSKVNSKTVNSSTFLLCLLCSETLKKLTKWKRRISETSLCIRNLIRMQIMSGGMEKLIDSEERKDIALPSENAKEEDKVLLEPGPVYIDEDDDMEIKCFIKVDPTNALDDGIIPIQLRDAYISEDPMDSDDEEETKPILMFPKPDLDQRSTNPIPIPATIPPTAGIRPKRESRTRAETVLRAMLAQEEEDEIGSDFGESSEASYEDDEMKNSSSSEEDNRDEDESEMENEMDSSEFKSTPKSSGPKKPTRCNVCNLNFACDTPFKKHIQTTRHKIGEGHRKTLEDGTVTFICNYENCSESFHCLDDFWTHHKTHKPRCELCSKEFGSRDSYKEHLVTPGHRSKLSEEDLKTLLHNRRKFRCKVCDKVVWSRKVFRKHQLSHTKPFICETCGMRFSDNAGLKHHQAIHIPKPPVVRRKGNRFIAPHERPLKCKECDRRFVEKSGLHRHIAKVHKGIRHKCDSCPNEYVSSNRLQRHKKTVHEKLNLTKKSPVRAPPQCCEICTKSCSDKGRLTEHMELVHLKMESCPYACGSTAKFATIKNLSTHLEQCPSEKINDKSKSRCHFCGDIFRCELIRMNHHLSQHKVFSCDFCDRRFTKPDCLRLHKLSHKESKPFLCSKCGKGFRQVMNLQFHSITVCGEDEEAKKELITKRRELHKIYREKKKPFGCDQCSKGFIIATNLEDHKTKVHSKITK